MIDFIIFTLSSITVCAVGYILLYGIDQRMLAKAILLVGFLSITVKFTTTVAPIIKNTKNTALEMRKDVQEFTNAIKGAGQSIDKISKPLGDVGKGLGKVDKGMEEAKKAKDQLDELTEKTKIPGIDSVDKAIEEWFKKIISGEKKGE